MSDRRLIFLLSVAQRRVQRFVATQPPKGVTATQAGLLFVLGRRDGVLLGEAGAALDLGMPGISGLVERAAEAGLIEQRADPDDGRAWRPLPTAAGRRAPVPPKAGAAGLNARPAGGFREAGIGVVGGRPARG